MVGIALMVERWYEGSQFLCSLWEKEACAQEHRQLLPPLDHTGARTLAGSRISGGDISNSSAGLSGSPTRLVVDTIAGAGFPPSPICPNCVARGPALCGCCPYCG